MGKASPPADRNGSMTRPITVRRSRAGATGATSMPAPALTVKQARGVLVPTPANTERPREQRAQRGASVLWNADSRGLVAAVLREVSP